MVHDLRRRLHRHPFTDLLFGAPVSGAYAYLDGPQGFRQSDLGIYAQDNYKATNRLTLNLGLRYENFLGWPWTEVDNKEYQFAPAVAPHRTLQAGTNGVPSSGVEAQNLELRASRWLSVPPADKTVLHAGYGLYYGAPNVTNSSVPGQQCSGRQLLGIHQQRRPLFRNQPVFRNRPARLRQSL